MCNADASPLRRFRLYESDTANSICFGGGSEASPSPMNPPQAEDIQVKESDTSILSLRERRSFSPPSEGGDLEGVKDLRNSDASPTPPSPLKSRISPTPSSLVEGATPHPHLNPLPEGEEAILSPFRRESWGGGKFTGPASLPRLTRPTKPGGRTWPSPHGCS